MTHRDNIRSLQLELGTIEILQALKAGIDQDLSDFDEEMKDPDPKLRPIPETKKSLEVYELELRTVIERLDASEREEQLRTAQ
jgi:hypothetical protein